MKRAFLIAAGAAALLAGCNNGQPNNGYQQQGYNQGQQGQYNQQYAPQQGYNQGQQAPQQQAAPMPVPTVTQTVAVQAAPATAAPAAASAKKTAGRTVNCSVEVTQLGVNESGPCQFEQVGGNGSFTLQNFKSGTSLKYVEIEILSPGVADVWVDNGARPTRVGRVSRDKACWGGKNGADYVEVCAY